MSAAAAAAAAASAAKANNSKAAAAVDEDDVDAVLDGPSVWEAALEAAEAAAEGTGGAGAGGAGAGAGAGSEGLFMGTAASVGFGGAVPRVPRTAEEREAHRRVVVVLWGTPLETVRVGGAHELLNCDDHVKQLRKARRNIQEARPDIAHQCLLSLLDSPLNKAGRLQVYIHTTQNVLIEINPQCRIPRTFPRFAGLMVQLLHKFKIRASNSPHTLMQVIKNPITQHFPTNCVKIGFSHRSGKVVDLEDYASVNFGPGSDYATASPVFVIGGFSHGDMDDATFLDEEISISRYQLSAMGACGKLTNAFERLWDIL